MNINNKSIPGTLNYKGASIRDFKKYADRNKVTDTELPKSQLTKDKTDCKVYNFRGNFVTDCKKDIKRHQLWKKCKSLEKECRELRKKYSDVSEYDEELMRYGKPMAHGQGDAGS